MSQIVLLTGPERRRRWRDEDRLAILEEAFAAGARSKVVGDPVIQIELAAARVSVCAGASSALVSAVLKALR